MDDCSSNGFFVCGIFGVIVNGIAMYLLRQRTDLKIDSTQRCILFNLCLFDFCQNVNNIILESMNLMKMNAVDELLLVQSIFSTGIYFATFWLVLDRYLHIKLNMMYVLRWSQKKKPPSQCCLYGVFVF